MEAEKELAKAKEEVVHEVKLAREAEAEMNFHVKKAAEIAVEHEKKHHHHHPDNNTQCNCDAMNCSGAPGPYTATRTPSNKLL